MNPTIQRLFLTTALAAPIVGLASATSAQGGLPDWNRRLTSVEVVPGPTETVIYASFRIETAVTPTVDTDLSTDCAFLVNGVEVGVVPVPMIANPSEQVNSCGSAGSCSGSCGFSTWGLMGCATHIPTGTFCVCAGSTLAALPLDPSSLQPGDEIMVLLRPAPGAIPEPDDSDDSQSLTYGGEPVGGDPHYGWIELTVEYDPATASFDVFFEVEIQADDIPGPVDLSHRVELHDDDGLVDAIDYAVWRESMSGPEAMPVDSFQDVPVDPGGGLKIVLKPAPGALPELPGFEEEDEQDLEIPTLFVDTEEISVHGGGTQNFTLEAGPALGGQLYFLVGSATGTNPGVPIDGVVLPLTFDGWMLFCLQNPNTPPYSANLSLLNALGEAAAAFTLPVGLPPALVGIEFWHAYATFDLFNGGVATHASNYVKLTLVL